METRKIYAVTMTHYLDWLDKAVDAIQTGNSADGLRWLRLARKNLRDACLADVTVEVLPASPAEAALAEQRQTKETP